jgi:hypothetical protein
MDKGKVDYLYKTHVKDKATGDDFSVLGKLTKKEQCPVCKKWKNDLVTHIARVHR